MLRIVVSVLTLIVPLVIGMWMAKQSHQDDLVLHSKNVAARTVIYIERLINYAEQANNDALPLLSEPCEQALPMLRKLAAFQPFIRSVNLVKNNVIVCSSILGSVQLPDDGAFTDKRLWLSRGNVVRPGMPILVVRTEQGSDAVRAVIDADIIGFALKFIDPSLHAQLHVGDNWLGSKGALSDTPPLSSDQSYYEAHSRRYPLSVNVRVESPSSWSVVWEARYRVLSVLLVVSAILAGAVYWFMGQPRSLYSELVRGLRAREFVPYLQPIMDQCGKRVVGAEVLMRWRHPSGELIGPNHFIPQAEANGLIGPMTVQLMEMVGDSFENHVAQLPVGFDVGFNISAHHCKDDELLLECRRFMTRFPQGTVHLMLELTERELFMDDDHALALFKQLDELGVRLAIDDFGTGHSNFSYLQRFHIHCLKIDKSFVSLISTGSLSNHIIENIIDLANRLDLVVVAEGVETCEQANYLEAKGVDMQQGYLYGKPVPLDTFIAQYVSSQHECECRVEVSV